MVRLKTSLTTCRKPSSDGGGWVIDAGLWWNVRETWGIKGTECIMGWYARNATTGMILRWRITVKHNERDCEGKRQER